MRGISTVLVLIMGLALVGAPQVLAADQPVPAGEEFPATVDLRPNFETWELSPRNQGERGTCSMFATTGVIEYEVARVRGEHTRLSVEYLNWAANGGIGKGGDGGYFSHAQQGFEAHGICPDAMLPYADKFDAEFTPSQEMQKAAERYREMGLRFHWIRPHSRPPGLSEEQFAATKRALVSGHPVAIGSNHSRALIGYRDDPEQPGGGVFITLDSLIHSKRWAKQCTNGFGEVSYEYARTKVYDAFWVEIPDEQKPEPKASE